ncbi:MAG TPA: aminoglycoside phosphotransferase family protein [Bryobacteraceae bacterium]|nr:aminoglycoside phosphotransferase family protein [Bryobacteraceae bacterium]
MSDALTGTPAAARTIAEPRRSLPPSLLARLVQSAFAGGKVSAVQPLTEGYRNSNFKLRVDSFPEPVVLRIYEHDETLCQKEMDLYRFLGDSVPVPELIHAAPLGDEGLPPFAFFRYVEALTFRELKHHSSPAELAQAAHSVGETLAAIHRHHFDRPGWLNAGPSPGPPLLEGPDAMARFVDLCLAAPPLQERLPTPLRDRIRARMWSCQAQLAVCEGETNLVHNDFGKRNILVRQVKGRWTVAAVLDWEFAVSGTPLGDLAHFLRFERAACPRVEPSFSDGYCHAGGTLPDGWRALGRVVDLVALCEALTRESLPEDVTSELCELVRATVEDRDPQSC